MKTLFSWVIWKGGKSEYLPRTNVPAYQPKANDMSQSYALPGEEEEDEEEESSCDICGGSGEIEITKSYLDDSHTWQEEGTGRFKPCPVCNEPVDEDDDS